MNTLKEKNISINTHKKTLLKDEIHIHKDIKNVRINVQEDKNTHKKVHQNRHTKEENTDIKIHKETLIKREIHRGHVSKNTRKTRA